LNHVASRCIGARLVCFAGPAALRSQRTGPRRCQSSQFPRRAGREATNGRPPCPCQLSIVTGSCFAFRRAVARQAADPLPVHWFRKPARSSVTFLGRTMQWNAAEYPLIHEWHEGRPPRPVMHRSSKITSKVDMKIHIRARPSPPFTALLRGNAKWLRSYALPISPWAKGV